jgi:hypothetical protein
MSEYEVELSKNGISDIRLIIKGYAQQDVESYVIDCLAINGWSLDYVRLVG